MHSSCKYNIDLMVRKSLILLSIILFSSAIFAQTVKITGIVRNSKNVPMEYVSISSKTNGQMGTWTNAEGKYSLQIASKDSTKLVFTYLGYQTIECTVPYLPYDVELNVIMYEKSKELATVTVSGEQKRVVNMTVDDFSKRRAYLLDGGVETLIGTYSGVSTTNELSSQYFVRGGSFDENIIYVNNIEIYRPLLVRSAQQEGLSFINPNMVQNVAFSTGGYSAEYGDKMSSVLDISYKKPSTFEGSVNGSLLGGGAYIGNSSKRFSQMTSIRYKTTKALLNTMDTDAEYEPSFTDLQSYMTFNITPKWQASFLGNYSHNKYKFTPESRETTFGTLNMLRKYNVYLNGWEDDKFETYLAALTLEGKLKENLKVGLSGSTFASDEQENYDIQGSYRLTELILDGNGNSLANSPLLGVGTYMEHARNKLKSDVYNIKHFGEYDGKNNQVKWGISYQREKITDKIKEWEMRDSSGYSLPNTGETVNVFSNVKADNIINSNRFSGYIQDHFRIKSNFGLFVLNTGIRASYWDFNEEFIVSPRVSVHFIPDRNDKFIFRMASGVYYQTPFYKEFQQVVNIGNNSKVELNRNIKSQKSIHFVLGSDYSFKSTGQQPFKFTSEFYYKKLSDIIPYTINNVKVRYSGQNEGKGYIMGLDMRLYGEFVPGSTSWISFSLMKTEQDIHGVKVPLPTDQTYNFSIYFQDQFPGYERLKMNLKGHLSKGLPVSAPYKRLESGYFHTPAYKRVDVGFSWELLGEKYAIRKKNAALRTFRNIWLGMDILNIFDIKNVNTYYWITDVYNNQYAIPNYLTGRQVNVKLLADF